MTEFGLFNIIIAQPKAVDGNPYPFFIEKEHGQGIVTIHGDVTAVIRDVETGLIKHKCRTTNIVTNAGDLYYAERGQDLTSNQPTNFTTAVTPYPFDGQLEMWKSVSAAPSKTATRSGMTGKLGPGTGSTTKSCASGYPKVNDSDADNTGKGADILTYKFSYAAGDWSDAGTFTDVDITNPSAASNDVMLMWADGLTVVKSATDTLVVYVNHTLTGA